jgi:tetratricopeptide (TPR) repeat protein
MSIESLKAQARRHEQQEEWLKALDQYGKAIEVLDKEDQPDIGLLNRVADLYVKVGDFDKALSLYERAIELYREAYLPNNAIAVCKKLLRHIPHLDRVHLLMGQIRAEQGFVPEARTNFLAYAQRMQAAGNLDESFRALVEFCDLVPEEVEVRLTMAEQMIANARESEGVAQMVAAYRQLKASGREDRAFGLEARILELDPAVDFDAVLGEEGVDATGAESVAEPDVLPSDSHVERSVLSDADAVGDVDAGVGSESLVDADALVDGDSDGDDPEASLEELPGSEEVASAQAREGAFPDEAPAELPAAPEADASDDLEEAAAERPTWEPDEARETEGEGEDARREGDTVGADLPLVAGTDAFDDEEGEDSVQELPMLSFGDEEETAAEVVDSGEASAELPTFGWDPGSEDTEAFSAALEESSSDLTSFSEPADAVEQASVSEGDAAATSESSDGYVDLGSMLLGDRPSEPQSTRFRVAYQEPTGDEVADFQQMLSQFKEKVSENLGVTDVRAHHDLGTAYKEMGLLDEAVSEFQSALRASATHLPTYELLGQTFLEMGQHEAAAKSLERALQVRPGIEDEFLGIYYYLGRAYEKLGRKEAAVEFYDRVFSLDINFADVTERLRALR